MVLPTGLGKTGIALMLASHKLKEQKDSKIVFLAPTKPLAQQHMRTFSQHLNEDMNLFTGEIAPDKSEKLWEESKIILEKYFENTCKLWAIEYGEKYADLRDKSMDGNCCSQT